MPARPSLRRSSLLAGLAVAATSLVAIPLTATANPAGTGLVITEVYGAGGNGTAPTYGFDFIELYNAGTSAVDVSTWSVQYRSAAGTSAAITPLVGTIEPGHHYLVKRGPGDGRDQALPTADATGTIAMGGGAGVVLLASNTTGISATGNLAANAPTPPPANLVDMVGFGTTPTSFETANTGVALGEDVSRTHRHGDPARHRQQRHRLLRGHPDPRERGHRRPRTPRRHVTRRPDGSGRHAGRRLHPRGHGWHVAVHVDRQRAARRRHRSRRRDRLGHADDRRHVQRHGHRHRLRHADHGDRPVTFSFTVTAAAPIAIAAIQGNGATTPFNDQRVTTGASSPRRIRRVASTASTSRPRAPTPPDASDAVFVYGGTSGFAIYPAVGDSVGVAGTAGEFVGATQVEAAQPASRGRLARHGDPQDGRPRHRLRPPGHGVPGGYRARLRP